MNLKSKIERILSKYPYTRNDDIALTIKLWQRFYPGMVGKKIVKLEYLHYLPAESDIKRIRAILQNEEGRFMPTCYKVAEKRNMKRVEWENYIKAA